MGVKVIFIQSKDCEESTVEIPNVTNVVVRRISSVLQFTVMDGFRPSFDKLETAECDNIQCLFDYTAKRFKPDVAEWVEPRLKALSRFVKEDAIIIPTCLKETGELIKRLIVGLLYVLRSRINVPIILDDTLSFVVNEAYFEAFLAMMRPAIYTLNRLLLTHEIVKFNPVVVTPGGQGGFYRLGHPYKYVVIFDNNRWELPLRDIEKFVRS